MTTLKTLTMAALKVGAIVHDTRIGQSHSCGVEAPPGHHWSCGLHELVDSAYVPWKPDYGDLLARMNQSIEPCGPDCEWWTDDKGD